MKRYDYLAVVTSDVLRYLKDNEIEVTLSTRDEVAELLTADLLTCDSVTGNGSGSLLVVPMKPRKTFATIGVFCRRRWTSSTVMRRRI